MLTLSTVMISLFLISLAGWTVTTYLVKQSSQKQIRDELKNLYDISRKFLVTLKKFIGVLASISFTNDASETNFITESKLDEDEQLLNLVQPVEEIESTSLGLSHEQEVNDTALSSFSPEVIEVINEEEEKVA
tara:strand:- start:362 stop:760 length:399 start_codon:yes stop_codon:yes gene_type:complete